MIIIMRIVPNNPLGPYPHAALWGHAGKDPTNKRIRITSKTVDNIIYSICISKEAYGFILLQAECENAGSSKIL